MPLRTSIDVSSKMENERNVVTCYLNLMKRLCGFHFSGFFVSIFYLLFVIIVFRYFAYFLSICKRNLNMLNCIFVVNPFVV